MKVFVNDEERDLTINDPERGGDFTRDYLDEEGALMKDFQWDETKNAYRCSPDVYDHWKTLIETDQVEIDERRTIR